MSHGALKNLNVSSGLFLDFSWVTGSPSLIRLWKAGRQSAQNPSTRRVARGWRSNRVPDY